MISYKVGDQVHYFNPGHRYNGYFFLVKEVSESFTKNPIDTIYTLRALIFSVEVFAYASQIVLATSRDLTRDEECPIVVDTHSQKDPFKYISAWELKGPHDDHIIVDSYALGKTFKYCKECKVEVL